MSGCQSSSSLSSVVPRPIQVFEESAFHVALDSNAQAFIGNGSVDLKQACWVYGQGKSHDAQHAVSDNTHTHTHTIHWSRNCPGCCRVHRAADGCCIVLYCIAMNCVGCAFTRARTCTCTGNQVHLYLVLWDFRATWTAFHRFTLLAISFFIARLLATYVISCQPLCRHFCCLL
jgi:hypothetical protein